MAAAKQVTYTDFLRDHNFFAIFDDGAIDEDNGGIRVDGGAYSC